MNWNDLSRYRAPLMGFAMIIVMLFHVPLSRSDAFYGLMRCGNNGVDMFLFLSGIGLWYSWTKNLPQNLLFGRNCVSSISGASSAFIPHGSSLPVFITFPNTGPMAAVTVPICSISLPTSWWAGVSGVSTTSRSGSFPPSWPSISSPPSICALSSATASGDGFRL